MFFSSEKKLRNYLIPDICIHMSTVQNVITQVT